MGNQLVRRRDLTRLEQRDQPFGTLAAGYGFAPDLGRQFVGLGRLGVPQRALRHVRHARGDLGWQGLFQPAQHRLEDIALGVFLQQRPIGRGRDMVDEEGHNRAAADVFGDVFFGVVGTHLALVDVLFEDIAQHVGVDFVARIAQLAVVEVPGPTVEERKNLFERRVGDG